VSPIGFTHLNLNPGEHFTARHSDLMLIDFTGNWSIGSVSTGEQSLLFSFPNEIGYCQDGSDLDRPDSRLFY
jgi:hypothetical protein